MRMFPPAAPFGFRKDCGINPVWHNASLASGHSNFQFVDQYFDSCNTVQRIFSLARKLGFRSFCVEDVDPSTPAFIADNEEISQCTPVYQKSKAYRVSFFLSESEPKGSEDFLGYVIIKKDFYNGRVNKNVSAERMYVYESVLKPYRTEKENNFIRCKRDYAVSFSFGDYTVNGALYAQQNAVSSVCAHVGLRSVLSLMLPHGDISYADINAHTKIDKRTIFEGLDPISIQNVLNANNIKFRKIVHEPTQLIVPPDKAYNRNLYGYIESGCPALLAFEFHGERHVVPVLGHTFNEDTWIPEARRWYFKNMPYYSSEGWLSTYLVHDDNFGPYLCIPREYLEFERFRLLYGVQWDHYALCYDKIEIVALDRLLQFAAQNPMIPNIPWYNRFAAHAKNRMLVLRSMYMYRDDYIQKRIQTDGNSDANIERLLNILPDRFWMVEVSCPELFSASRSKFGEIFLACDTIDAQFNGHAYPIALRLPGLVYIENEQLPYLTNNTHYSDLN